MIYAGIGARDAPDTIIDAFIAIGKELADRGYTLRSGGAHGCDKAFEFGCKFGLKEIYLPWKFYNRNFSPLYSIPNNMFTMTSQWYPSYNSASSGVRLLHARNTQQILGQQGNIPCNFVVCWTKRKPTDIGGTMYTIHVANIHSIPVYNFYYKEDIDRFYKEILSENGRIVL